MTCFCSQWSSVVVHHNCPITQSRLHRCSNRKRTHLLHADMVPSKRCGHSRMCQHSRRSRFRHRLGRRGALSPLDLPHCLITRSQARQCQFQRSTSHHRLKHIENPNTHLRMTCSLRRLLTMLNIWTCRSCHRIRQTLDEPLAQLPPTARIQCLSSIMISSIYQDQAHLVSVS